MMRLLYTFLFFMVAGIATAQTPLQTSFETGYTLGTINNQNNWKVTAGTAGVVAANPHTGTQSLQLIANNTALTTEHVAYSGTVPGITGEVYADMWVKPVAYTTKGLGINGFDLYGGSSKRIFAIEFTTDNKIKAYNGSSGANVGVWTANQWVRISVKMDFSAEKYQVAINGTVDPTSFNFRETYTPTASGTRPATTKEFHSLRFNHVSDAQVATTESYVDDIYVSTSPITDVSFGASSTTRTITVTQPAYGTITLNPTGPTFNLGQSVTATLTLPQGYMNNGWTGDLSGTALTNTFTVNGNMAFSANTGVDVSNPPPTYTITVNQPANGTITLSPAATNNVYYKETKVTATVSYEACYQLNGWTGALSGTAASQTFTVSGDATIGADIVPNATPAVKRVVTTVTEFKNALNAMNPGDTVEVADGSYNIGGLTVTRSGCSMKPIVITARNTGMAVLTGSTYFLFKNMNYVTFKGFTMKSSGIATGLKLENCTRMRITGNTFNFTESGSCTWVYIGDTFGSTDSLKSGHNVVDHNIFDGKTEAGNYIRFDGNIDQQSRYDTVRYNFFKNNGPRAVNEKECIRIGVSTLSRSNGYTVVEHNLFQDCDGDPEIVSVKSFANKIRYNTFVRCLGTVCLRQGNGSVVEGNYFFGDNKTAIFDGGQIGCGGIRVYGKDHLIINNYFSGLTGEKWDAACTMTNGDVTNSSTSTSSHFLPENVVFAFNTLVNNSSNIEIGFDNNGNYPKPLINCTIANNIVVDNLHPIIKSYNTTALANTNFEGNIMYTTGASTIGMTATAAQIKNIDPMLMQPTCVGTDCNLTRAYNVYRISPTSPAVNTASGTYAAVTLDGEEQPRSGLKDVGADEYQSVNDMTVTTTALDSTQVGPNAIPATYSYTYAALPVTIYAFNAYYDKEVKLQWSVGEETNLFKYIVEWSINGRDFTTIATVDAKGYTSYTAAHTTPVAGINYYRIQMLDKNGSKRYSVVRTVNTNIVSIATVYPNPAKDYVNISFKRAIENDTNIRLLNTAGMVVKQQNITTQQSSVYVNDLPQGVYRLQIVNRDQAIVQSTSIVISH